MPVVLSDLPAGTDLNSIRVEGKASGALEIGAVDAKRIQVLHRDSEEQKSERRRLEDAIERENRPFLQLCERPLRPRKSKSATLKTLPVCQMPAGYSYRAGQARSEQDWARVANFDWQQSWRTCRGPFLKSGSEFVMLIAKLKTLKKQLAGLAPRQVQRTEVKINVVAGEELTADLLVRYQVRNARWTFRFMMRGWKLDRATYHQN